MPLLSQSLEQVQELIGNALGAFTPELVLSLGVIVLLLHDLFGKTARPTSAAVLTGIFMGLAGLLVVFHTPAHTELFGWVEDGVHRGMTRDDPFAKFFRAFCLAGGLVTIPMCLATPAFKNRKMGEFYALLLAAVLGMLLMASATNLLMMYLGIEFASMASYLGVAFLKRDRAGSEAGLKYVIYGSVASGIMVYGMSLLYGLTGSLHLIDLREAFTAVDAVDSSLIVSSALVFAGFAYKMAAFPMHFWCPDVYQGAPVPFTAFLSVTSKAAGFAVFIRFLMAFRSDFGFSIGSGDSAYDVGFGWSGLVAGAAALSMFAGNLAALWQTNIKRMLAYSSVAHAGYLLMGVAVLKPGLDDGGEQFKALLFYLVVYFCMNLAAFYIVALVAARTGREDLGAYKGLGRRTPWLGVVLTLCLVSLLGIPPTAGFTGKLAIFEAVIRSGMVWLAVIAGINTAISAYYYFRVAQAVWLDEGEETAPLRPGLGHVAIVVALALPLLLLFLKPDPVADLARSFGF